ncbi:YqzL family protein [Paenibacillus crassostreae]|nr:YqzL family protein [Paenibacillus crassostreae]
MRDFSWKYFAMTGDVDAYLLFKEAANTTNSVLITSDVMVDEMVDYDENE